MIFIDNASLFLIIRQWFNQQGPSHRLEVSPGFENGTTESIIAAVRHGDLSTDDEDRVNQHMRQYETKIDSLMSEVGTLKSEVSFISFY